jgi:lipoprotein NlpI
VQVANNYGIGFLNPPNARKAIRIFATALEVFPQYSNAHYNKALAHFLLVRAPTRRTGRLTRVYC